MRSVAELILKEWNQFQQVRNEGGRASCQNPVSYTHLANKLSPKASLTRGQFATMVSRYLA